MKSDGTIEIQSEYPDPMTGKMAKYREVYHIENEDHHWLEMFTVGPDGKEFRAMEGHYHRKK